MSTRQIIANNLMSSLGNDEDLLGKITYFVTLIFKYLHNNTKI